MNKVKQGFTLIELLVVIAVIAVLISIILPALKKTKDHARMIVCRSNIQQIGIGAHLYAESNDDFIPRGGAFGTWFKCFLPYLGQETNEGDYRNVKIYRCPGFPDRRQTVCFVVSSWTFDSSSDMTGHEVTQPTKLDTFKSRVSKVYLADNEEGPWRPVIEEEGDPDILRLDVWNPGHLPDSANEDKTLGRRVARRRHRQGANYLFLDWHAEYVATEDMNINYWRDK